MARHHIRKREGPRGVSWYATVDLGRDPATGKRRQKHVSGPTRKACEAEIATVLERHARGESVQASRITVAAYLDQWLDSAKPTLKPTSYRGYREYCHRWLAPLLGHHHLAKLTPLYVQAALTEMLGRGLSPTTVRHTFGVLHTALNQAVRWGLVPRNVCAAVDPPRRATPEMRTWSIEEVGRFLVVAANDDLDALWRLALTTGMRRGELLGLRWIDVDVARGALAIRHTLVRGEGSAWESSTPKTAKGQRSIALSTADIEALTRHRDRQRLARLPNPLGFVFVGSTGKPINHNVLRARFNALIARADVPRIRFHDLRHTAATLMLIAGEHPKVVQERLGHSTIAMTLDRYSHVSEGMQQAAAERLEQLLSSGS